MVAEKLYGMVALLRSKPEAEIIPADNLDIPCVGWVVWWYEGACEYSEDFLIPLEVFRTEPPGDSELEKRFRESMATGPRARLAFLMDLRTWGSSSHTL